MHTHMHFFTDSLNMFLVNCKKQSYQYENGDKLILLTNFTIKPEATESIEFHS